MDRVAGFVGSVQLRLKIDQATSNTDDPTPIWQLDELAQAVGSQGDNVNAAVDHIVRRLGNKAPNVKQKALRAVRHLCTKGSPEFRRQMAKHSSVIRELTGFRCEPDPFKGDIPWKRVQQLAQEALASLHGGSEGAGPSSGPTMTSSSLGGRIQGFGSDAAGAYSSPGTGSGGGGLGSASRSSGRMVGFGSDSLRSSGGGGSAQGGFSSGGGLGGFSSSRVAGASGYTAVSSGAGGRVGGGGGGQGLLGSFSSGVQSLRASMSRAPQDSLLAEDGYSGANGDAGGDYGRGAVPPGAGAAAAAAAAAGGSQQQEARAVDKVCTPAGLRAAPDREDLQAFVEAVSSLDGREVARLLQERMERGPWQATLRALCAVEAVIESGSSAPCGEIAVHFQANPDPIRRASGSPQASVRQRASKVLKLIGDETLPRGGGAAPAAAAPPAPSQVNLMSDLLGEPEQPAEAVGAPSTALALDADLLGGSASPAAASQQASHLGVADLLGGLEVPSEQHQQQQQQQEAVVQAASSGGGVGSAPLAEDLFSGLSVPAGGQRAGPGGAAASLGDLLGGPSTAAAAAAAQRPAPGDPFGGLAAPTSQQQQQQQQPHQAYQQQQPLGLAAAVATGPAGGDLFSGLSMGGSTGSGSVSSAANGLAGVQMPAAGPSARAPSGSIPPAGRASRTPQGSNNLDDLLSGLNISTHHGPQQPMKASAGHAQQAQHAAQFAGQQGAAGVGMGAGAPLMQPQQFGGMMPGGAPGATTGLMQQQGQPQPGFAAPYGASAFAPASQLGFTNLAPQQQQQAFLMQQQQQQQMLMMQMGLSPLQQAALLQQQQLAAMQRGMVPGAAAMGFGQGVGPVGGAGIGAGGGQVPFMMGIQPPQVPVASRAGSKGPVPLEEFHDTISHQPPAAHAKDASFDFIGDHLKNLKK
ncbi:hypothetical protein N2152v2_002112 [Parachlorella kessleri]